MVLVIDKTAQRHHALVSAGSRLF